MLKRPAFYVDIQTCSGCKTCVVACRDKNNLDSDGFWRRVVEYSGGEWIPLEDGTYRQNVFCYYISVSCNHCDDPICVEVCPTTAMHQDESGIVQIDQSKCVGCRYCEWACPYSAPRFVARSGRMSKCDFCEDLLEKNLEPACVAACPTRALQLVAHDDPRLSRKGIATFAPLPSHQLTNPNTVFSPHLHAQPRGKSGFIANQEENGND